MSKKIQNVVGWALLFAGIGIIFWGLSSSYNIFNNKSQAPEIFKIEAQKTTPSKKVQGLEAQVEEKMKELLGEQLKAMLPADSVPKLLNLISWSIFIGILIFGGAQLAGIGIKLLREKG
ncbi:MAG: hypothetical protein COT33_00385 [Candidatus Nealsonbacteria bacterium CG08_land_8_20_14_0_20_38_20]|uniref:Uncharacterized protein n=1 Tax=Candidatus Nealsonbacteria bacterium CG08_land_8_20_14_0_20_38_20 TaxID=1974705 RepID=A0A2H0YMJ7_9BACT|nr:MAG: hypothetical protein COT33_00385 [Candidatus Nealsonbacteria bacterium CG08_land_8_20_14_0_20_38_20]